MTPYRSSLEILEARIAPATIYGVNGNNELLSFSSSAPGTVTHVTVTGLAVTGEHLQEVDFRPSNGVLYGLGIHLTGGAAEGRIYKINPATGQATQVGTNPFSTQLSQTGEGFEIDPVNDFIRVVDDASQLFLVSPDAGALINKTSTAASLKMVGAAYTNNVAGAAATTLFAIDFQNQNLVRLGGVDGNPLVDGGTSTVIGPLGLNLSSRQLGFDIESRTGTAYASAQVGGSTHLYTINLVNGAATDAGAIGAGTETVSGLAVALPNDLTLISPTRATYRDVDGDTVFVVTSKGTLAASNFHFATKQGGSQLLTLDLSDANKQFAGTDLAVLGVRTAGKGDGFANVGHIEASNIGLGQVTIVGDLGSITVGNDGTPAAISMKALTVQSMGVFGFSTQAPNAGTLDSRFSGKLSALTVQTDLDGATLGTVAIGNAVIFGNIIGRSNGPASAFGVEGGITVSVGANAIYVLGSIIGGSDTSSGVISVGGGHIGSLLVGGDVVGGSGEASGSLAGNSTFDLIQVNGSVIGGSGASSGRIFSSGSVKTLAVGGSLLGHASSGATNSGSILFSTGIFGNPDLGLLKIGGSVQGGGAALSGGVFVAGKITTGIIGGSVLGGTGGGSADLSADGGWGSLAIGGSVLGSGVNATAAIQSLAGSIGNVTIGGSLAGTAGILVTGSLGQLTVGGDVRGVPGGPALRIFAQGVLNAPTAAAAGGIQGITIRGGVENAAILAGYDADGFAKNPDASIGIVVVGRDWVASSLVAGVQSSDGFGNGNDVKIVAGDGAAGHAGIDNPNITATITGVVINGLAIGTESDRTDHFGIVAEKVGVLRIGTVVYPLTAGLDAIGFPLGASRDFRVREVTNAAVVIDPIPIPTTHVAGTRLYAVNNSNTLISFTAEAPGTTSRVAISGLGANEVVQEIDFRPSNGLLYGVSIVHGTPSETGRLYIIDPATGEATQVGTTPFATDLDAPNDTGFDFDPVADLIRLTDDTGANLRINPDTGALVAKDTGTAPATTLLSLAYSNNYADAPSTTLYGIDYTSDQLVRIGGLNGNPTPNSGSTTMVGSLGFVENFEAVGFDIESRTGIPYAAFTVSGVTGLYTINLSTGAATLQGGIGTGDELLFGLAVSLPSDLKQVNPRVMTYTDYDGDTVTVAVSKGTLSPSDFQMSVGEKGSRLQTLNLSDDGPEFSGAVVAIAAAPTVVNGVSKGDGFMQMNRLEASGVDLGVVYLPNTDLAEINAGDTTLTTPALASLTVHSMGVFTSAPNSTGSSISSLQGNVGSLSVATDLKDAAFGTNTVSSVGAVVIGGNLNGGVVSSQGTLSTVSIGGSIIGHLGVNSGTVTSAKGIAGVGVGGDLLGGSGDGTGSIGSNGPIGAVLVKGNVIGGPVNSSGEIFATANVGSINIGGSLLGSTSGTHTSAGDINVSRLSVSDPFATLADLRIGGNVIGGAGDFSGFISADRLGSTIIFGSVISGGNSLHASVLSGDGGNTFVGGSLRGGSSDDYGIISSSGSFGNVTIHGNVLTETQSLFLAGRNMGVLSIGGSLLAGTGAFILPFGTPGTLAGLAGLTVAGSVKNIAIVAGRNVFGDANNADGSVGTVSVGGNWIASRISAGVDQNLGGGTGVDDPFPEDPSNGLASAIASIVIKGYIAGTPAGGDSFAFVAQQIGSLRVGTVTYPLTPGASSAADLPAQALGATGDFRYHEV